VNTRTRRCTRHRPTYEGDRNHESREAGGSRRDPVANKQAIRRSWGVEAERAAWAGRKCRSPNAQRRINGHHGRAWHSTGVRSGADVERPGRTLGPGRRSSAGVGPCDSLKVQKSRRRRPARARGPLKEEPENRRVRGWSAGPYTLCSAANTAGLAPRTRSTWTCWRVRRSVEPLPLTRTPDTRCRTPGHARPCPRPSRVTTGRCTVPHNTYPSPPSGETITTGSQPLSLTWTGHPCAGSRCRGGPARRRGPHRGNGQPGGQSRVQPGRSRPQAHVAPL